MSAHAFDLLKAEGRCCVDCHETGRDRHTRAVCFHNPECCCCQMHRLRDQAESRIDTGRLSQIIYELVNDAMDEYPAEGFTSTHAAVVAGYIRDHFEPKKKESTGAADH